MITSDDELMCRFQKGDETAFRRLLERYQDRIINFVFRMLGDEDTAMDIAQEVFVKIYLNAGRYLPGSRFAPWLYRIASNLAINEIRRRKRWRFISIDESASSDDRNYSFELADESATGADEVLLQKEASDSIEKAMTKIPVKYRAPLVLREIEGYDYDEISQILNIPRGTVKSRLNRGRALLKTALYRVNPALKTAAL
ncbi:sigma-70 family RNA polymerase sigma factor [bacterium]|nr:sigma-70 family RNA polymerase sigma factor [candidate division CSSED10-310 bacterium]